MTAINFPDSPSNGDTHVVGGVTYTYDSTETKWKTTINSNAFLPLTGGTVSGNIVLDGELQHSGDTDTKLHFDTDTIKFDTAGSERVRIDSSGNVSIGSSSFGTYSDRVISLYSTTNPSIKLSNSTTGSTLTDGIEVILSGSDGYLWNRENASWIFGTNNVERMRLTSTGDLRFNSGYGSAATAYGVRAWVCFNGNNGTVLEDGNVSSVTDNATGNYTINFSTSIVDTNYAATGSSDSSTGGHGVVFGPPATGSIVMKVFEQSGTLRDHDKVFAIIVR